ncbi:MAG: nuclear transport factor 2 family protein [Solirubrobacterales bacterium]
MSEENVEVVRQGYEAWRRTRKLDFDLLDPDVEWVLHGTPAGDVSYRGWDGVRTWFAGQDDAWSDQWWEVEEVRQIPDGRVLALIIGHAVGRDSGVPVSLSMANIWTIKEGRATRLEIFLDRKDALEAAGLSE